MEQFVVVGSPGNYVIKIAETDEEKASGMSQVAAQQTADNLNVQTPQDNTGSDDDTGGDEVNDDDYEYEPLK